MKVLVNKFIQIGTTIIILCIVVYGIVYAQQACCRTIVDACIPASNRIFGGYNNSKSWATSQSYESTNHLQLYICSKKNLTDYGPGNTCCETDPCDIYNQTAYFSLSFIQDLIMLQKSACSSDADDGTLTTFEPYSLPTSLDPVPIYILTQSIIC